ncbi:putative 2-aminoethylphosphonate ABC transporter ATP-binding protein [Paracoccus versutus]|uniref:putative 2-aminoethylphosphonate ABC transporter ATP-binding protein n=1 Tax=Paracoccus versutus TaxID=34007 RepID=UPI000DF79A38|nr:putative 2-aminoethylphosphonate ABC transporter ATP-binding protein [Paracoccus versutus]RDD68786.1 putative 2-aminoethylphosphonate ABC transporter ATP-binding protein [Paracoccus versutus]
MIKKTGTAPDEGYLTISNLEKYYGPYHALRDVSLSVRRGEFVCFLGPSGCGKTTLLRAIAGLDPQSSGQIWQDGRDISLLPPARRDFGIVFQSYALFPNLSVIDNVAFGLRNTGVSAKDARTRAQELLAMVGISEHAQKYPSQLSGGQQQRVAIARALAMSPGLLLLDEPLSALDARVRVRLREELHDLQRRVGVTSIMVTHDQEEALSLADRIVVMNAGRVEQFDTPQRIYSHPANRFVAEFVGDMTLIDGQSDGQDAVRIRQQRLELGQLRKGAPTGATAIGIRPEDLVLTQSGTGPNTVTATVDAVEFSGASAVVRLHAPTLCDIPLRARLSLATLAQLQLAEGISIGAHLPPDALHVFPVHGGAG